MTAFVTTDIPSAINTLEKLHAWSGMCLAYINAQTATVQEVSGVNQPVAVHQVFDYTASGTNRKRMVFRISVEVNQDFLTGSAKAWTFVQDLSTTAIPTAFKAN